ncbi:MAG: translation elongation factor Ts [Candidatus Peribacteraceae bacterium]|nr:translation elongation factor Ts [Candidatus Peribacteraceae bacterium]
MSSVSASQVASLRSRTGVSILECKNALEEVSGDEEKAIEALRKRGAASATKKAERDQSEGSIFLCEENEKAALIFLRCETDFVSSNKDFIALGNELATLLCKEGEDALRKIAKEKTQEAVQKLGENISLGETSLIEGGVVGSYLHSNSRIGVIVSLSSGTTEVAKDVAMHAAAMNPEFIKPEDVTKESVDVERNIWTEQLSKEGKPAEIMDKIMLGKEKKFREENALTSQNFVKDPSITVKQHIGEADVSKYVRLSVSK